MKNTKVTKEEFMAWAAQEVVLHELTGAQQSLFADEIGEYDPHAAELLRKEGQAKRELERYLRPLVEQFAKDWANEMDAKAKCGTATSDKKAEGPTMPGNKNIRTDLN